MATRTVLDRKPSSISKADSEQFTNVTNVKNVKIESLPSRATPVAATKTGSEFGLSTEDDLSSRYKMDRKACMQQLLSELHIIGRRVLDKHQVSDAEDERIAHKSGMLVVCKAPRPWLAISHVIEREIDDFGVPAQPSFVWLFIEADDLLRARGGNHDLGIDSRMEPAVAQFFDKIAAFASSASGECPQRLPCELDSYSFEAVSCLINDYFRSPSDTSQQNHTVPGKRFRGRQHRDSFLSSPKRKRQKQQEDAENVDSSESNDYDTNEQQYKVLQYNEAYDYGQDWWEPKDSQSYRKMFANLRVHPSVAEPVYELARAFGRKQLELDSEIPMVWQWGVEVRRLPWSIPCFTWLSSKLSVACDYGNAALQNYLLINLEKNGLGLTEALALYEFVAASPVVAMYVERELTEWQKQDAGAVEWILSELQLCQASKDKLIYTTTLANAILLRIACIRPQGATMLRNALRDAHGKTKSGQGHTLCTYMDRYPRILLLADAKAQFTLDISELGVTEQNLLNVLRIAANAVAAEEVKYAESDVGSSTDDAVSKSSSRRTAAAEPRQPISPAEIAPVTFTFDLCRSSTEFAVELARSLNIIVKSIGISSSRGTPAAEVELDDRSDGTPMRSRLRRPMLRGADGTLSKAHLVSEKDCKFINWQFVEIKQIPSESNEPIVSTDTVNSSSPYKRATEFRCLPFVYMPSEELINLRTFRRLMPLNHPMVCMLLHTLYDNDDFNMLSPEDEATLLEMQKKKISRNRNRSAAARAQVPLFHYRIRLTADSVSQLFSRQWKLQGDHRPAVVYDIE